MFNMEIQYCPGLQNGKADALSRKPEYFKEGEKNPVKTIVWNYKENDDDNKDIEIFAQELTEEQNEQEERHELLEQHHDALWAGHGGVFKTLKLIQDSGYDWLGLRKDIEKYVKNCVVCQRNKNYPQKPFGPLIPTEIPDRPWEHITIDLITGLPEAHGSNAILVVVCKFSKMVHYLATRDNVTAKGVTQLLAENVWRLHGLPTKVISDRGPQFTSSFMKELNKMLGIHTALSTAYHPQTDRQTERVNQELEMYLCLYCLEKQYEWPKHLHLAEFAHNNRVHKSTGKTPFQANYRINLIMLVIVMRNSANPHSKDFAVEMEQLHAWIKKNLESSV